MLKFGMKNKTLLTIVEKKVEAENKHCAEARYF